MRRFQIPNAALVAGLAVLLSGCSGETPTAPSSSGGTGNGSGSGSCTVLVSMSATTQSPLVGTASIVRATVTRAGVPVPDGGSVQYTTDLGLFEENGLNTISKTTVGGVADVTVFSSSTGTAHVKALFDCANAQINLNFGGVPDVGPYISSLSPTTGSCAGGDVVTILGGRFGTGTADVFFGGVRGSIKGAITNTQINVTTPAHPLKNNAVPETVNVVVVVNGLSSPPFQFTYACIPPGLQAFLSSLSPTAGSPAGGDSVLIFGGHLGTNIATTQVTFCGAPATIVGLQDQQISVSTPVHHLANPAISETCDVTVRRDIGLVSENSATLAQAFTYRGNGSGATCNTDPTFFIASLTPNSGPPEGGTTVTLTGSGFGATASLMRVDFGGTPATILNISNTQIQVSTPIRTLANPSNPETVDVTVTDLGSPAQRCARVVSGFTYTAVALTPTIFSVSPRTGPNDTPTRVSIFGDGFQFPMQVFMTGGACGAQRVEAQVASITLNTIVFSAPAAIGGNVCLSSQLVDVVVLNPSTGKTATCPACFKYYPCPTITAIAPGFGPYTGGTQVVISGHNFEEPAVVTGGTSAWSTVSVSSEQIIAITPRAVVSGCSGDISAPVLVTSTSLSCPPETSPPVFTYFVKTLSPFITNISPPSVPQGGGVVTVTGGNFIDNMRAVVNSVPVLATVTSPTQLTFTAPSFTGTFPTTPCTVSGVAGTQAVPATVPLHILNVSTTCVSADDVLTYNPTVSTCVPSTPLAITTNSLPNGTNGGAYNFALVATGGAPPYAWSLVSGTLPTPGTPAVSLSAGGVLSGTPTASGIFSFTVKVTDTAGGSAQANLSITIP